MRDHRKLRAFELADNFVLEPREVEYQLTIAQRLGYLQADVANNLMQRADETARVLAGLLRLFRSS